MKQQAEVGWMIRAARKRQGRSMRWLGERVGVSEQAISQYELGKRPLQIGMVQRIANALGVSMEQLLPDQDEARCPDDQEELGELEWAAFDGRGALTDEQKRAIIQVIKAVDEPPAREGPEKLKKAIEEYVSTSIRYPGPIGDSVPEVLASMQRTFDIAAEYGLSDETVGMIFHDVVMNRAKKGKVR